MYNRKSRRQMAKMLGFFKNQDTIPENEIGKTTKFKKRLERTSRANEAGKQIHLQFVQLVEENQKKANEELDARKLQNRVEWYIHVYTGNEGKGLSNIEAEKRAREEHQTEKMLIYKIEEIRSAERDLRKMWRKEGLGKKEIKEGILKIRQEMKADGTYVKF